MNHINREVYISVADIMQGCKAIAFGFSQNTTYKADDFDWMVEFVMDNYFSNVKLTKEYFMRKATTMHIEEELAVEILAFVTKEILLRIQRTFEVIFPNRNYTFVWITECGTIRITETTTMSPAEYCMTRTPILQEPEDGYVPERLRGRY